MNVPAQQPQQGVPASMPARATKVSLTVALAALAGFLVGAGATYLLLRTDGSMTTVTNEEPRIAMDAAKTDTTAMPQNLIGTPSVSDRMEDAWSRGMEDTEQLVSDSFVRTVPVSALATLASREEQFSSIRVPTMPGNDGVGLISTEPMLSGMESSTSHIYTLDLTTGALRRVFSETDSPKVIRTLGLNGSRLVMLRDGYSSSHEPCFSPVLDGDGTLVYLDLADIASGLHPYDATRADIDAAFEERQLCIMDTQTAP